MVIVQSFDAIEVAVQDLDSGVSAMGLVLGCAPSSGTSFRLSNVRLELSESSQGADGIAAVRFCSQDGILRLPSTVASPVGRDDLESDDSESADLDSKHSEGDAALHFSPEQVYGLDHLVVRSRDVDATRDFYSQVLGLRVLFDREFSDWGVRLCMLRLGDAVIEVAGRLAGGSAEKPSSVPGESSGSRDRLWGLTWRVADADAAHARLSGGGLDISDVRAGRRPGTRVFTVREGTCNVPTLIIETASEAS